MPVQELSIAIVGSGGDGVVTAGEMIAQAAAREGLHVIKTEAYGPQIRGGESSCTVRVSTQPLFTQADAVDVLVVFNWADFSRFRAEITMKDDALIIHEASDPVPESMTLGAGQHALPIALVQLARDAGAPNSKNILTLGALCEIFGLPADAIRASISKKFGKKKAGVAETVLKSFEAGIAEGKSLGEKLPQLADRRLVYTSGAPRLVMSGNEAAAVAAIHAGCRFFAGYPITPSSEILHLLGEWMPKIGGTLVQTEDELAAIGAVIGASFAGVKSMTATSGPGLSLMTELLGLSAIAEVPAVVVNVQRGGPSTGIPTKSEQSDLFQAVWGGHGDQPRVVIAPTDVEDCFHATVEGFNIAEEYQIPVIVLSDQLIGQRKETVAADALVHEVRDRRLPTGEELADYRRYRDTPTGVSPMAVPGMAGGMYQTNGLEHDEYGRPNSGYLTHEVMNEKRYRKLRPIRDMHRFYRRFGPATADLGIICWGSSKGTVKEAVERLNARGESVAAFVPQMIYPFPKHEADEFLASVKKVLVVELSFAAQFYKYLRTFLDLPADTDVFNRSGGKNLTVVEIEAAVLKSLRAAKSNEVYA